MQDPIDLETAYQCATAFESASDYGTGYHGTQTAMSPMEGPTPMDLSALQEQNKLLLNLVQQRGGFQNKDQRKETRNCFYCDKAGHLKKDCFKKKRDDEYKKKKFQGNNNNYNGNNHRFRQQLNALLDKFDPLENNTSNNNSNEDNSFDNKNLIDLSFGGQDSSHYSNVSSATMDHALIPEADIVFLNNLNNSAPGLPLYKAMVGGSDFKILIDSGASTNYVHPKLVSHALTVQDVHNQAVETADGKQSFINQKILFRMFLGDHHKHEEVITAFVFESKFDIILGRNWLKSTAPVPDWFEDSWEIRDKQFGNVKIYPIIQNKTASPLQVNNANVVHEVVLDKQETNVNYLLSANQMARYLKKEKITECYVVNFIDQNTGNSASITPINPSLASDLKIDREWKEEFAKLYPYAFKGELTELPPHRATRDIIVTNPVDAPPIYHPPYRMSPLELKELKRQLEDLEKKGLIVPTASPYGFPILFVRMLNYKCAVIFDLLTKSPLLNEFLCRE